MNSGIRCSQPFKENSFEMDAAIKGWAANTAVQGQGRILATSVKHTFNIYKSFPLTVSRSAVCVKKSQNVDKTIVKI